MSAKDFLYSIREAEFEKRALKREQKRMEEHDRVKHMMTHERR